MAWRSGSRPAPREWTLLGIPFRIDASWLVIVALVTWSLAVGHFPSRAPGFHPGLYWAMGAIAAILLFACVVLHELGHSLAARRHGIPVAGMVLFIFGGVAEIAHDPKRPSVELTIALAGPVVSAGLAGACSWVAAAIPVHEPWQLVAAAITRYLALINVWILLFNLLPGFPLDGGRVLRAVLWAWTGDLRAATRIASVIGSGLGLVLIGVGLWVLANGAWIGGLWYIFLGSFLRNAARMSARRVTG